MAVAAAGTAAAALPTALARLRTLNIPERQVLRYYEGDPNGLDWHHRILLERVEGSSWVICTPDLDVYACDLNETPVRGLERNAGFPWDVARAVYCFDAARFTAEVRQRVKGEARALAEVLGAELGAADQEDDGYVWVLAEAAHADFGHEFRADELVSPDGTQILDDEKGVRRFQGKLVFIENVLREELEEWKAERRPGLPGGNAGGVRILGNFKNKKQQRQLTLAGALELSSQEEFKDWPF